MLTLPETKLHLRVDHDAEDGLIAALMATATAACANHLNMPLDQLTETVPQPIKSAALLLVGTLYEHRESQGDRQFHKNPAFEALLNPYRIHA